MERELKLKEKPITLALIVILLLYIIFLIKVAFFKESAILHQHMFSDRKGYIFNLTPFKSITEILNSNRGPWYIIQNICGNIYLFIPLGIFLPLIKKNINYLSVITTGILISIGIETTQYILIIGNTDIDDVILNTIGTFIGLITFLVIKYYCKDVHKLKVISLFLIMGMGVACISAILMTRSDLFFPPQKYRGFTIQNK